MKRLLIPIFLLAILLCSCQREYNILTYQENEIVSECTINNKYDITITKCKDFLRLDIISPASLAGVSFEIKEGNAYAIKDDISIPIDKNSLRGICAILNCFSLKENEIATVNQDSTCIFNSDYGTYTVTYGENDLPKHIEISTDTYNYSIAINSILLK